MALACPMCSPLPLSLTEELELSEAIVLAQPLGSKKFKVTRVLKGKLPEGKVLMAGSTAQGNQVLLYTAGAAASVFWTGRPRAATPEVVAFAEGLVRLPDRNKPGAADKRLAFMADYLEHAHDELAAAAADEFARASLEDVQRWAKKLGRDRVLAWVKNPKTPQEHKAVYYVMLGGLAVKADLPLLEQQMQQAQTLDLTTSLTPLIACYLSVKGSDGLAKIEADFLSPQTPPRRLRAALDALRFHANYETSIQQRQVVEVFARLLDSPRTAGFVLRDLAIWKEWSVTPRVAALYEQGTGYQSWLKIAVVRFLITAPTPEAQQALAELRQREPKLVNSVHEPYRRYPGEL